MKFLTLERILLVLCLLVTSYDVRLDTKQNLSTGTAKELPEEYSAILGSSGEFSEQESILDFEIRPYVYPAEIIDVYDGDTYTAKIFLNFDITLEKKLRLARADTPELRGKERPDGLVVRDNVREWILGEFVYLEIYGTEKYGRTLTEVYFWHEEEGSILNMTDFLFEQEMSDSTYYFER